MRTHNCINKVSHKDYKRMKKRYIYCLSSVLLLSCDDWPGVTSPSRSSRLIRECQAV